MMTILSFNELRNTWPVKYIKPNFQPGPLLEFPTIVNNRHAANRILTCAEPEFRHCSMHWSDNHYAMAPIQIGQIQFDQTDRIVAIWYYMRIS